MVINSHLSIKELPIGDRPYEKLEKYGERVLTDAELLAIIIKTGTKSETAVTLSQKIIKNSLNWVEDNVDISLTDLKKINGVGRVKAIQIKAVIELSRRFSKYQKDSNVKINTPKDIFNLMVDEMRFLKKEHVKSILLDSKNQVIKIIDVSVGTLNSSIVHPREVFCEAIKCCCASFVLIHNHPSGDPNPSGEDIAITKRLNEAGKIIGIDLLDHIIFGNDNYISLKEKCII